MINVFKNASKQGTDELELIRKDEEEWDIGTEEKSSISKADSGPKVYTRQP